MQFIYTEAVSQIDGLSKLNWALSGFQIAETGYDYLFRSSIEGLYQLSKMDLLELTHLSLFHLSHNFPAILRSYSSTRRGSWQTSHCGWTRRTRSKHVIVPRHRDAERVDSNFRRSTSARHGGHATQSQLETTIMALPSHLRTSITPEELELVASEQLVEIIPLVAMERTAFISVR